MAFRTNKTPVLQEKTASGSVASFNTALAMPLPSCNIAVNAWQEGSGDPSPVNDRPIHGFDKVNLVNSRIVPVNKLIPITAKQSGSGDPSPDNVRPITAGLTIVRDDDSVLEVYEGTLDVFSGELIVTHDKTVLDGNEHELYQSSVSRKGFYLTSLYDMKIGNILYGLCDKFKTLYEDPYATGVMKTGVIFALNNKFVFFTNVVGTYVDEQSISAWRNWLSDNNVEIVYPLASSRVIQLSATELARAKEALGIDTYTIQLGQEVYGAEVDAVNGKLVLSHQIILLDGSEAWSTRTTSNGFFKPISDMKTNQTSGMSNWLPYNNSFDSFGFCLRNGSLYANQITNNIEGITNSTEWRAYLSNNPLTAVYELATPIEVQLTPTQIETLIGNNTIFADTGDIDLTYNDLDLAKRGSFREVFKLPS